MKHVSLISELPNGEPSFALLGPGGRIKTFDLFLRTLRKAPFNTKSTYSHGIARFFDYFFEAVDVLTSTTQSVALTHDQVVEVLEAYSEYLVFGVASGNQTAQDVARANPSPMVSPKTCEQLHAPLRKLLQLSEHLRKQMAQLAEAGLVAEAIDPEPLMVTRMVQPTPAQRRALEANSLLAAVVADGPKLLEEASLPTSGGSDEGEITDDQAFPFDLVGPLISHMPTHRDKALHALCAASGCRIGEALQVLWEDIDPKTHRVRLVSPRQRANHRSYLALSPAQRKKYLSWKSRITAETLLIEPFASIFFEELENYRRKEWIWNSDHDFVFQHVSPQYRGKPFVLSSRSTRSEAFAKAMERLRDATVDTRLQLPYSAHSFRHTYGFYLLNYFPRQDRTYGLPLAVVKQVMGHKLAKSTKVYARHDRDLAEEDIASASLHYTNDVTATRITELKKQILLARLEVIERELRDGIKMVGEQ